MPRTVDIDLTSDDEGCMMRFGYQTMDGEFIPIDECYQTKLQVYYQRLKSKNSLSHSKSTEDVTDEKKNDDDDDDVGMCFVLNIIWFCIIFVSFLVGLSKMSRYDRIRDQILTLSHINFRYDIVIDSGDVVKVKNVGVFEATYSGDFVRVSENAVTNSDDIELNFGDAFYVGDMVLFQTGHLDGGEIVKVKDFCNQSKITRKINLWRVLNH